jgi:hypothetical protein
MPDEDLKFEIDGPDVHQRTVDAESALALFLSYLELVRKAAKERGAELAFHGLEVEEKCLRIASLPSDGLAALAGARDVSAMLARQMTVPYSLQKSITTFRRRLEQFPQRIDRTTVQVGRSERLEVEVSWNEPPVSTILETFSGRVIVKRVGGATPTVRLRSRLEPREMTLDAEKDLAEKIGAFLYKEVEVDARVRRDEKGMIVGGNLLDFEPVTDEDPTTAWGNFFREAGDEWGRMGADEINEEIGRD